MVSIDDALVELQKIVSILGYPFNVISSEVDSKVVATIQVKNFKLELWFRVDTQLYGFSLLNGGYKSFGSPNDLLESVKVYIDININLIPRAKQVCDTFEKCFDINAVYQNFQCNSNNDVLVIFTVLGETDKQIVIKSSSDYYIASLVQFNSDKTKTRVIAEYKYSIDGYGNIKLIPTISYFTRNLFDRYEADDNISIVRDAIDSFLIKYSDGLIIDTKMTFNDGKIQYNLTRVEKNGVSLPDLTSMQNIILEDTFSMSELKNNVDFEFNDSEQDDFEFVDVKDENEVDIFHEENTTEETDTLEEIEEEEVEEEKVKEEEVEEEKVEEEAISEEAISEEAGELINEESEETDEKVEEVEEIDEKAEEVSEDNSDVDEDLSIMLINNLEGNPKFVRFVLKDNYYDMDINKARELGIPVNKIIKSENQVVKRGMLLTPMELSNRIFADDISDNNSLCSGLVDKLYS